MRSFNPIDREPHIELECMNACIESCALAVHFFDDMLKALGRSMNARRCVRCEKGYCAYCRILVRIRGVNVSLSTRDNAASHCPVASRLPRRLLMRLPKSDASCGGGFPQDAMAAQSEVNAAPAASRFRRSRHSSPLNAYTFSVPSCSASLVDAALSLPGCVIG
jgi:hypothetical protein